MDNDLKVFDNVLCDDEFSDLIPQLNAIRRMMPCPHTDELIERRVHRDLTLNVIRPRVNCYGPTNAGVIDLYEDWVSKREENDLSIAHRIMEERDANRIHGSAHHGQWLTKKHLPATVKKIVSLADTEYAGVEWWCYDSKKYLKQDKDIGVVPHIDSDGGMMLLTGKRVPAKASVCFYSEVGELSGGDLRSFDVLDENFHEGSSWYSPKLSTCTKRINKNHEHCDAVRISSTVSPKTNRAVVIPHGVLHEVTPFVGRRVCFVFLLWDKRPIEFI